MPKNLVICCDGTNNQFGPENTNVVRVIQALVRDPSRQRLYYDPGVGTLPEPGAWTALGKMISTFAGLAFGAGIFWKVQEAYAFLMEEWEPGDRVFVFGFSRGAYTARLLAAVLHGLGLLPRGNENLIPYVLRLFKGIPQGKSGPAVDDYFTLCNEFRRTFARVVPEEPDDRRFRVHWLGLWDTVSSVGWLWDPPSYPYTATQPKRRRRVARDLDRRAPLAVPAEPDVPGAEGSATARGVVPGCAFRRGWRLSRGGWRPVADAVCVDSRWRAGHRPARRSRTSRRRAHPVAAPSGTLRRTEARVADGRVVASRVPPEAAVPERNRTARARHRLRPAPPDCGRRLHSRLRAAPAAQRPAYRPPNLSRAFVDAVCALPTVPASLPYAPDGIRGGAAAPGGAPGLSMPV